MDETDIMTFMEFEDDSDRESVWICIRNALAYTVWGAYQYEKEKYLPQTIESVDYETIENFNGVYTSNDLANRLLQYLDRNYSKDTDKQVNINTIKAFIKDCI